MFRAGAVRELRQREHRSHQVPRFRPEPAASLGASLRLDPLVESRFLLSQPTHPNPNLEAGLDRSERPPLFLESPTDLEAAEAGLDPGERRVEAKAAPPSGVRSLDPSR